MLDKAIAKAREGVDVLVVGANQREAGRLRECIARAGGPGPGNITVVLPGTMGPGGAFERTTRPVFWDHLAHELTLQGLTDEAVFLHSRLEQIVARVAALRGLEVER